MRFVDTNVLLYAVSTDPAEQSKTARANELLDEVDLALSTQVMQEFSVQATRATPLTHPQAVNLVTSLGRYPVQPTTTELVHSAMETRRRFDRSYWDAAIIEAARRLRCDEVLSEDLSHGQDYGGSS